MKSVELFESPAIKARQRNSVNNTLREEMTDFELSFLCGLIREKRPRKILELGVAAGGTTAIIIECLNELGIEAEMFSVDISKQYYRNPLYPSGFCAKEIIEETECVNHRFLLGNPIPYVIEQIGDGIDFLVLDTIHVLPGELLDFITVLPFLTDGCTVVMHDINAGHCHGDMRKIATCLLFSGVSSKDKYRMIDRAGGEFSFSNIAAFVVSDGHKKEETIEGVPIYELHELKERMVENPEFVLGVDKRKIEEIKSILYFNGFCSFIF